MRVIRPVAGDNGVVLVMSLLILAMITILGVYASTRAGVEQKVAGNAVTATSVFYMAESALSHARQQLMNEFESDPVNQAAYSAGTAPSWSFALNGSGSFAGVATNYYCETGCTDDADLAAGAWTAGGVTVTSQTVSVPPLSYTYTIVAYDNNDTDGFDIFGNQCGASSADPDVDCDSTVILRATARAWMDGAVVAESVQEETLTAEMQNVVGLVSGKSDEGGEQNISADLSGSGVDTSGGPTIIN
jgi:Tfp pilus assembly protein PilX